MKKRKMGIIVSAHIDTNKENIGDILSAKAMATLLLPQQSKIFYLPRDKGFSFNKDVIYGGGGMIRPLFSTKVAGDFILRTKVNKHYIYGVGLNQDKLAPKFSNKDIL